MNKAKIICTIGPATMRPDMIRGLVREGMNAARLNFSYSSHADHEKAIKRIRKEAARLGRTVAIIQDLQGIKIRVGDFKEGPITLEEGRAVTIHAGEGPGDENNIYIKYAPIIKATEPGHRMLMNDGLLELKVLEKGRGFLRAQVITGGELKAGKGVNLPGLKPVDISFTEKDKEDVLFGLRHGVDYVALSFVRRKEDVLALREFLSGQKKDHIPIIAKIETRQGLKNIDEILEAADGIMVARGDLGVEIPPEDVPIEQKKLIAKANRAGKLVIVATEMLESMTERPRPTRAETTDVSNAVLDGADAVMLSQETSVGKYPLQALDMMKKIIETTGRARQEKSRYEPKGTFSEAVAKAATGAAQEVGAKFIVALTQSGYTARLVSMLRPNVEVLAFSSSEKVRRQMALFWGVLPRKIRHLKTPRGIFQEVERELLSAKLVKKGDLIVITAGTPNKTGTTSLMRLYVIGEKAKE